MTLLFNEQIKKILGGGGVFFVLLVCIHFFPVQPSCFPLWLKLMLHVCTVDNMIQTALLQAIK